MVGYTPPELKVQCIDTESGQNFHASVKRKGVEVIFDATTSDPDKMVEVAKVALEEWREAV